MRSFLREYGTEEFTADFSPATEEWQFASVQFSKSKYRTIQYIRVYCDYGYNSGTVYFDDVQLVRNSLETYLSASDFVVESTGTSDNAVAEATDTTPTFNEAKDDFGNALTETTFTDGDFGTIYRAFKFNEDDNCCPGDDAGNNLVEETDARGHKTTYTVDGDTSRNEEVTDRLGNKTAYEYDDSGRTTKVTSKIYEVETEENKNPTVSYAYDTFDNMTEIVRGDGMKYALAYNEFHNLESIGIEGKSDALIKYAYKNGNGRLKQMTYANGHTMKAVYNSIGQMVAEKWFETEAKAADSTATPIAHYKYVYDGDGNIVRSIDISGKKEYNYEYEEGRIVRATEADIELNGEIVTSKVIINTVKYCYDEEIDLYYLNSRYFDPHTGKFISSDEPVLVYDAYTVLSYNLFAYCENSSVNGCDSNGQKLKNFFKSVVKAVVTVTRKVVRAVVANPVAVNITQKGKFQSLFNLADFYRDRSGIYHTYTNCWQKYFGYNDLYDLAFYLGTDMKPHKLEFSYGGKDWIFWAWKGDYLNLGAGAELGIYNRLCVFGLKTPHWLAATSHAMKMELRLTYKGNTIIDYKPSEKQWWITGFNPYYQNVKTNQLKATFKLKFNNSAMFNSFYSYTRKRKDSGTTYDYSAKSATIKF